MTGGEWNADVMDFNSLRANVRQVVDEQERFCKDEQAAVAVSRETKRPSSLPVISSCTLLFVGKV